MDKKNHVSYGKIVTIGVVAALTFLAIFWLSGCVSIKTPDYVQAGRGTGIDKNTIFVNGKGTVRVVPDKVLVNVIIATENKSSEKAMDENSKIAKTVISAINQTKAENLVIETTGLSLEPLYYYKENEPPEIYAYRASMILNVSTTDIEKIGQIIADAIEAGANSVSSLSFDLSDSVKEEAKRKALEYASKDAENKAKAIAESMGVRLGKIYYISEIETYYPSPVYAMEAPIIKMEEETKEVTPPPVAPQEIEMTANIQVSFSFYTGLFNFN